MLKKALAVAVFFVATSAFAQAKAADKAPAAAAAPAKWVVTGLADLKWSPFDPKQPKGLQLAVVSGDPSKGAFTAFLKMPAGAKTGVHSHSTDYSAVVVQGAPTHSDTEADAKPLAVGTSWFQPAKQNHANSCPGTVDCIMFLSNTGAADFIPAAAPAAAGDKKAAPEKKK